MQINPYIMKSLSAADVIVKSKESTGSNLNSLLALYKSSLLTGVFR